MIIIKTHNDFTMFKDRLRKEVFIMANNIELKRACLNNEEEMTEIKEYWNELVNENN